MNREARAAGRRLLPIYQQIDDQISNSEIPERASCKRGCFNCCYLLVSANTLEAVLIADYLITSDIWKPQLPALKKKLEDQVRFIEELGGIWEGESVSSPYLQKKIPCVFLKKNGDCGIYKIRPLSCRTYYVITPPEMCDPDHPENPVGGFDMRQVLFQAWTGSLELEKKHVPPVLDSLQLMVLVALELLTREPKDFDKWVESHPLPIEESKVALDGMKEMISIGIENLGKYDYKRRMEEP